MPPGRSSVFLIGGVKGITMAYAVLNKDVDKLTPRHSVAVVMLDRITDPGHKLYDLRVNFPADPWLVEKIRLEGFTSTILVRRNGNRYEIIAGRRRHAACMVLDAEIRAAKKAAGQSWERPEDGFFAWVEVRNVSDEEAYALMIGENESGLPYTDTQRAWFIQRAVDRGQSMEEACVPFRITSAQGYQLVKLQRVDDTVREKVDAGEITVSVAAALSEMPRAQQREVVEKAKAAGKNITVDIAKMAAKPDAAVPQNTRINWVKAVVRDTEMYHELKNDPVALRALLNFMVSGDRAELALHEGARKAVDVKSQ